MQPLLPATYQPQVWVNDDAMDIDGRVEFDAAPAFFSQKPEKMLKIATEILEGRHDIDELAEGVSDHDGPFLVDVDRYDFTVFLALHGIAVGAGAPSASELARTKHAEPAKSKNLLADLGVDDADFSDILFDSWDSYSDRGRHQRMPPLSVAEILDGETRSIFIRGSDDEYEVVIGEEHMRSTSHPSLSLAMRAGAEAMANAEADLPLVVAREFGLDPDALEILVLEETLIHVTPKGEKHPLLVVSKERVAMSPDTGDDREYKNSQAVETAVGEFKEALAPSSPAP